MSAVAVARSRRGQAPNVRARGPVADDSAASSAGGTAVRALSEGPRISINCSTPAHCVVLCTFLGRVCAVGTIHIVHMNDSSYSIQRLPEFRPPGVALRLVGLPRDDECPWVRRRETHLYIYGQEPPIHSPQEGEVGTSRRATVK